jgi:hypothetical protein
MQNDGLHGRAFLYYPSKYQIDTLQKTHGPLALSTAKLRTSAQHFTWSDNWNDKMNLCTVDYHTTQSSTIPPVTIHTSLQPWLLLTP